VHELAESFEPVWLEELDERALLRRVETKSERGESPAKGADLFVI
jgi:hypothetical protein